MEVTVQDDRCVSGSMVVVREFGSSGVCHHHHIDLVWQSGKTRSYDFAFLPKPRGGRHTLPVAAYCGGSEKGSWLK